MMRELSPAELDELLAAQAVGRIGCHAAGVTYVVPVIYAREGDALYVATIEGQKVRMMRENPRVCFEVDEYEPGRGWRSVIAQGDYEELDGAEAERALAVLAARFGRRPAADGAPPAAGDGPATVCFRIRIREATGRAAAR